MQSDYYVSSMAAATAAAIGPSTQSQVSTLNSLSRTVGFNAPDVANSVASAARNTSLEFPVYRASDRKVSLSPPPGYEAVNQVAVQRFNAKIVDGKHVIVSDKSIQENGKEIKLNKLNQKTEAAVRQEYMQLTEGLLVNDGTLWRIVDGVAHDLGITPEGLVAMLRASHKAKDVAQDRLFVVRQGDRSVETVHSGEANPRKALLIKSSEITSGANGVIYIAHELVKKELCVIKEMKSGDENDDKFVNKTTCQEVEKRNLEHVWSGNQDKDLPIVSVPRLAYRCEAKGLERVGIVLPFYANSDFTGYQLKNDPRLSNIAQNILRIMDAVQHLDTKNVAHLDVKGGNIFVDVKGQAFLGDFDDLLELDDRSIDATIERVASGDYSSSPDSVGFDDQKLLESTAQSIMEKKANLRNAKGGERKQLEQELLFAKEDFKKICRSIHTFEVGMFALVSLTLRADSEAFSTTVQSSQQKTFNSGKVTELVENDSEKMNRINHLISTVAKRLPEDERKYFENTMQKAFQPIVKDGKVVGRMNTQTFAQMLKPIIESVVKHETGRISPTLRARSESSGAAAAAASSSDIAAQRRSRRMSVREESTINPNG